MQSFRVLRLKPSQRWFLQALLALSLLALTQCGSDDESGAAHTLDAGALDGGGGVSASGGQAGSSGGSNVGGTSGAGGTTPDAGLPPPPPPPGDGFVPLHPYRALDTRGGALPAIGKARCVKLAGTGTIPADAKAVLINLTAVAPSAAGYLIAHPDGAAPDTSTLSFKNQTVANGAIVSLPASGKICVTPQVAGVHFVIDVGGFFAQSSGYTALTPQRLLDTRTGAKPAASSTQCFKVAGAAGVADSAVAVALNVTTVQPDAKGFLRLHPAGQNVASTSTLNFEAGQTLANGAIVAVGSGGQVCVTLGPAASHYVVDVSAFFSTETRLHPLKPARRLDTTGGAQPAAQSKTCVTLANAELPASARGVVLNLVAVNPSAAGFAVVYPEGHGVPSTSTVNFGAGKTVANNAIIQPGNSGRVCVYTTVATHLIIDVSGYFEASSSGDPCASLNCVNPPPQVCSGGTEIVSYAKTGSCQHGTCIYADSAQACLDGCAGSSCSATYGWDYNLQHRCIKSISAGQPNYYEDTTDCPVAGRNWTIANQSEKALQATCTGVNSQSLPINAGGPLSLLWAPHVDELGRKNQQAILKSNFIDFAHPCGAGSYTWYAFFDHKHHNGGPNYPKPSETVFHANVWYDDFAPNGGSRLIATYAGEWNNQGITVEIDLQSVGWGDAFPSSPLLVQKKFNPSPPFQWVELDGKALGITVPRKQDTPLTIPWYSILSQLVAQGHLTGPSNGDLSTGVTTALNIATEVRNGGSGKNTVSAEARVSDFRISAK